MGQKHSYSEQRFRFGSYHDRCIVSPILNWRQAKFLFMVLLVTLLFNPSSPNTESLNQGPTVFSTRLMYSTKSGRAAQPPGTGADVASRNHLVIAYAVLL